MAKSMPKPTVYNNEIISWGFQHPELKLRVWPMATLGFDTPGYALITSEGYAAKRIRKIVSAFAKATFKGTDYAIKHPDEAVDILIKAVPELKKRYRGREMESHDSGRARARRRKKYGLGAMDTAKWQNLNDILKSYAVIERKVDLGKCCKIISPLIAGSLLLRSNGNG